MLDIRCNIWNKHDQGEIICITTNGYVKKNGCAVMGMGTAFQALKRIHDLDSKLGQAIIDNGNCVQYITDTIISFPVKAVAGQCHPDKLNVVAYMRHRFNSYDFVPGWAKKAELTIIDRSLHQLSVLGFSHKIYLPRPGCGAGGLEWNNQVRKYCEQYGDWLIVCHL